MRATKDAASASVRRADIGRSVPLTGGATEEEEEDNEEEETAAAADPDDDTAKGELESPEGGTWTVKCSHGTTGTAANARRRATAALHTFF